jgi:hypothetical protein
VVANHRGCKGRDPIEPNPTSTPPLSAAWTPGDGDRDLRATLPAHSCSYRRRSSSSSSPAGRSFLSLEIPCFPVAKERKRKNVVIGTQAETSIFSLPSEHLSRTLIASPFLPNLPPVPLDIPPALDSAENSLRLHGDSNLSISRHTMSRSDRRYYELIKVTSQDRGARFN